MNNQYVSQLEADLKMRLPRLYWMHNEPALLVAERFSDLRSQMDYDAELVIAKLARNGETYQIAAVNRTRTEFVRILSDLEKKVSVQPKPEVPSDEAFSSLRQRIEAFKASSSSLEDLEESYIRLTREIITETDRIERRIFGEQTVIYWPPKDVHSIGTPKSQNRLGSLVYFSDVFLSRSQIDSCLIKFSTQRQRLLSPSLIPATKAYELSKSNQVIEYLSGKDLQKFATASKFWYIGKTNKMLSDLVPQESSLQSEFVSYQSSGSEIKEGARTSSFDFSANIFNVESKRCRLLITHARLRSLHVNLLPSPADLLVELNLLGVHFDSFDTRLLATCTNLSVLKMQVTFSKDVELDLEFLKALTKLQTLELALPQLPADFSVFKQLTELRNLKLESLSFFFVEKHPRLSKLALEQIVSAPRLEKLELACFDVETIDREIFGECKHLCSLKLTRTRIDCNDDLVSIGFPRGLEPSRVHPMACVQLIHSGIRTLSAASFSEMTNLRKLSLTGNSIVELPRGVFNDLVLLERLDLDKNLIRHVRFGVFGRLKELRTLLLNDNPIESIETYAFARLSSLQTLTLEGCRLASIDSGMFVGLARLERLALNRNLIERIEVIAEDRRRINVAKADLSDEERQLVEKQLFRDMSCLKLLTLSGNKLEKLDLNCFVNLKFLHSLFLASNKINELSGDAEKASIPLKFIDLTNNHLVSVNKSAFPKRLIRLNLSRNRLKQLDEDFFAGFGWLKSVNLSQNELALTVTDATFASSSHCLTYINLAQNESIRLALRAVRNISFYAHIERDFTERFTRMRLFDTLRIRELTPKVVRALKRLYMGQLETYRDNAIKVLNLSGCSIDTLSRNPDWQTKIEMPEFAGRFNLSWIPDSSKLKHIRELDFSENFIETLDDPYIFADLKSITTINLSGNRLSRIHRDIFKCLSCLESIDLSGNRLSSIDLGLFRWISTSLMHLNLSSNRISFLNLARLFRICPRLQSLDLANNKLDDRSIAEPIDPTTCCYMRCFILVKNCFKKMTMVRDMILLEHLDVKGNNIESLMSNGENLLGRLSKLTFLDVSENRIEPLKDEAFDHLRH